MSYTMSYYHVVFRTYRSEPTIPIDHERDLYAYLFGIAKRLKCQTYRIGGMPDHVHMFVSLPPTLSIAEFAQQTKTASSKWMKSDPRFPHFNGWGREYAAFSYCLKDKDKIVNYIINQKEHHKKVSFAEEYRLFLEEHGITIKEQFFMKDD